jgi:hypothetical protein
MRSRLRRVLELIVNHCQFGDSPRLWLDFPGHAAWRLLGEFGVVQRPPRVDQSSGRLGLKNTVIAPDGGAIRCVVPDRRPTLTGTGGMVDGVVLSSISFSAARATALGRVYLLTHRSWITWTGTTFQDSHQRLRRHRDDLRSPVTLPVVRSIQRRRACRSYVPSRPPRLRSHGRCWPAHQFGLSWSLARIGSHAVLFEAPCLM